MSFELNIEESVKNLVQFQKDADIRISNNETQISNLHAEVTTNTQNIKNMKEFMDHCDKNIKHLTKVSIEQSEAMVYHGVTQSVNEELKRIQNKEVPKLDKPAPMSEMVQEIIETVKVEKNQGIEIVEAEQEEVHIWTESEFIYNKMLDNEYIVSGGKEVTDRFLHRIVYPVLNRLLEFNTIKNEYSEDRSLEQQPDKFYEKVSKKLMYVFREEKPKFVNYIERKYGEYKNSAEEELSRESSTVIDNSK